MDKRGDITVAWTWDTPTHHERVRAASGCEWPHEKCHAHPNIRLYLSGGMASALSGGWMLCVAHAMEKLWGEITNEKSASVRFLHGWHEGESG